jgi:peptide-methionine (S)-S-oxide reductase
LSGDSIELIELCSFAATLLSQLSHRIPFLFHRCMSTAAATTGSSQLATFAAGCFWSVELIFQREPGVLKSAVGYIGGTVSNPSYKAVCTGSTGHAEAVQLNYDPSQVSYERLLDIFWHKHDPTTPNRQGNDVGSQYRSAIFYHGEEQKQLAEKSKEEQQKNYKSPIVTEIVDATNINFWPAEEYHQQYLQKGGQCAAKGDKTAIRCYG